MNRRGFLGILLGVPVAAQLKPVVKAIAPDNRCTFTFDRAVFERTYWGTYEREKAKMSGWMKINAGGATRYLPVV